MAAETIRVYSGRGAVTQLMLGIVCAAIYGVALWATSFLPTIPGVTWLRPANMLSELFAVNFGWIGALGIAFGNSLSVLLRGQFNPTILWWVFPLEFIATAMVVYWGVTDPSLQHARQNRMAHLGGHRPGVADGLRAGVRPRLPVGGRPAGRVHDHRRDGHLERGHPGDCRRTRAVRALSTHRAHGPVVGARPGQEQRATRVPGRAAQLRFRPRNSVTPL